MKVLYTGGARSGKSRQAQEAGERLGERRLFVATAEARDQEMEERIKRHRVERGGRWTTVEEPLAPYSVIQGRGGEFDLILVDCLTLWVSNLLCNDVEEKDFAGAVSSLVSAINECPAPLLLVTNEVGGGIVPADALSRRYRDMLGTVNQQVAAVSDSVILMIAGLPLVVKGVVP